MGRAVLLVVALGHAIGCSSSEGSIAGDGSADAATDATAERFQPPPPGPSGGPLCDDFDFFQGSCSGTACHAPLEEPAGGLNLHSPGVADRLVSVRSTCGDLPYIDPDDPAASFLLDKIVNEEPSCGDMMPRGPQVLTASEIECVRRWVFELVGADAGPLDAGFLDATAPTDGGVDATSIGDASNDADALPGDSG